MVRCRNNIILVKTVRPSEVELPNGRHFLARYKRTDQNALPANIRICRTYSGRLALGRQARIRRKAKPANHIRDRGFKSFTKKAIYFAKKAAKNPIVRDV